MRLWLAWPRPCSPALLAGIFADPRPRRPKPSLRLSIGRAPDPGAHITDRYHVLPPGGGIPTSLRRGLDTTVGSWSTSKEAIRSVRARGQFLDWRHLQTMSNEARRASAERRRYIRGGTKRQMIQTSWMQTCMRPSLESCTGKLCGTIAVPTPDVTTSCGNPPPAGTNQVAFSTGAQSFPEQHSLGYQACAATGADHRTIAATSQRIVEIVAFTGGLANGVQRRKG